MNRKNKIILGVVLVAILLMGIGYAALAEVQLTINVTAKASANAENFKVVFTKEISHTGDVKVTPSPIDAVNGTKDIKVEFSGLQSAGDAASVILEIENKSDDIDAKSISVATNSVKNDVGLFTITTKMCDKDGVPATENSRLDAKEITYVEVKVVLNKNAITDISEEINLTVTAVPDTGTPEA